MNQEDIDAFEYEREVSTKTQEKHAAAYFNWQMAEQEKSMFKDAVCAIMHDHPKRRGELVAEYKRRVLRIAGVIK
jgi:hypothetical protein